MNADELCQAARELVRRDCAEQGIPEKVADPVALRRTAALIRGLLGASGSAPAQDRNDSSDRTAA
jgi:hypothetical protein